MYIYNVTVQVSWDISQNWLQWLREEHAPEVLETGCFQSYKLYRLVLEDNTDGPTFVVQYLCEKKNEYLKYQTVHAPVLQQKAFDKFGNQFTAFRSVLEEM